MTIDEAVQNLLQEDEFKQASQTKAYLRNVLSRYKKGELKAGAMVQLLLQFGYTIEVKKPRFIKLKK